MQTKELCKKNRLEKCAQGKTLSEQLLICQQCASFNEKYRVVNRLEYAMFERSKNEEQEVKTKKGQGWAKHQFMAGFMQFFEENDPIYYEALMKDYKSLLRDEKMFIQEV